MAHITAKATPAAMAKEIYRTEGFRGLYRGIVSTVIGIFPFAGCTFMAYEVRVGSTPAALMVLCSPNGTIAQFLGGVWSTPRDQLNPWQQFTNGCVAAAFRACRIVGQESIST